MDGAWVRYAKWNKPAKDNPPAVSRKSCCRGRGEEELEGLVGLYPSSAVKWPRSGGLMQNSCWECRNAMSPNRAGHLHVPATHAHVHTHTQTCGDGAVNYPSGGTTHSADVDQITMTRVLSISWLCRLHLNKANIFYKVKHLVKMTVWGQDGTLGLKAPSGPTVKVPSTQLLQETPGEES